MKKTIRGIVAIMTAAILGIAFSGCTTIKPDEAEGYVQANLDLIFQGETKEALKFLDASETQLKEMHVNGIDAFIQTYIAEDIGATTGTVMYHELVDEIFSVMKYRVDKVKKSDGKTYLVSVEYQPVNLFPLFVDKLKEESLKIEEDAKNGKYEGTDEEIQTHMLLDYMTHSFGHFEDSYLSMEYAEKQTYTFTVGKGKKGIPKMEEEQIQEFIRKIMMLDKI